jgi:alkanesulfonate monooxygenase SsuD/methylene tetrahydromethanopterin reductase-like flavin-dependent oxidoreductase (luciferase family)
LTWGFGAVPSLTDVRYKLPSVRYGVTLPPFGEWSNPRTVMEIAADADASGWDGFFLWDHVTWNPAWGGTPPIADPWMCLAAAATVTSRVSLGTMVTPLPRRRPQKVAREVVTVDHLSGGRVVLGVGLGDDYEYRAFGEPLDGRGARLDESLSILAGLFSGEPVDFEGKYYRIHSPPALPRPVHDRIPIWVGGHWPNRAPFARAARYDGVVPRKVGLERGEVFTVDDLVAIRAAVGRTDGYNYVVSGLTEGPADTAAIRTWEEAGATWWLESIHPWGGGAESMRNRVRAGPPRV